MVVVNQPQAAQPIVQVSRPPQASSYMILAAVLMVVCLLHGNLPTLTCLIPALIFAYVVRIIKKNMFFRLCEMGLGWLLQEALLFSLQAEEHNRNGEYDEAKRCGFFALCCSISSILYFVVVIIALIIFVILVFAVGIFNTNIDPDPYPPPQ